MLDITPMLLDNIRVLYVQLDTTAYRSTLPLTLTLGTNYARVATTALPQLALIGNLANLELTVMRLDYRDRINARIVRKESIVVNYMR